MRLVALLVGSVAVLAGCGGAGRSQTSGIARAGGAGVVVSPSRTLAAPGCSTAADPGARLAGARTAMRSIASSPFGVVSTADGRWSFVASARGIAVVSDATFPPRVVRVTPLASGFHDSGLIGEIPTGIAPVGMAISPDGRRLYVTSELAGSRPLSNRRPGATPGTLSVIDLARAETSPAHATLATVTAGCQPVRVAVSPDGRVVWVTARASDRLLGFAAARLTARPTAALAADVRVGEAPVGLAVADQGRVIVVADSDRFDAPGQHAALTVVSADRALRGRPAVPGSLPAGGFPRELSVEPDGRTLLVTNFRSAQLEAVDLGTLP